MSVIKLTLCVPPPYHKQVLQDEWSTRLAAYGTMSGGTSTPAPLLIPPNTRPTPGVYRSVLRELARCSCVVFCILRLLVCLSFPLNRPVLRPNSSQLAPASVAKPVKIRRIESKHVKAGIVVDVLDMYVGPTSGQPMQQWEPAKILEVVPGEIKVHTITLAWFLLSFNIQCFLCTTLQVLLLSSPSSRTFTVRHLHLSCRHCCISSTPHRVRAATH